LRASPRPSTTRCRKFIAAAARRALVAYLRRDDENTLGRALVECAILLAASRANASQVLREAATAYKVDSDAIAAKVKEEFAAKEKAKKATQPAVKSATKAAWSQPSEER
jgi:ParB family transcriptional regulator, chromosome partitioning protein